MEHYDQMNHRERGSERSHLYWLHVSQNETSFLRMNYVVMSLGFIWYSGRNVAPRSLKTKFARRRDLYNCFTTWTNRGNYANKCNILPI